MNAKNLAQMAIVAAALGAAQAASAVDVHVTGSGWGIWITGVFEAMPISPDTTHYSYMDMGSGAPMDFMMELPDGTFVDGAMLDNRMIGLDVGGSLGAPTLDLLNWSFWVGFGGRSVHVIIDTSAALSLEGITDAQYDYAADLNAVAVFTLIEPTGEETIFTRDLTRFEFSAPVPAPGAASLLGLAGLASARRRRR